MIDMYIIYVQMYNKIIKSAYKFLKNISQTAIYTTYNGPMRQNDEYFARRI